MTRTFKFRAWDNGTKKWVDDVLITCNKYGFLYQNYNKCEFIGEDRDIEIMQFTGLLDKNGKEIYEGDIIKYEGICSAPNDNYGKPFYETVEVKFIRGCFEPFNAPFSDSRNSEVIGNIYENPQILERK